MSSAAPSYSAERAMGRSQVFDTIAAKQAPLLSSPESTGTVQKSQPADPFEICAAVHAGTQCACPHPSSTLHVSTTCSVPSQPVTTDFRSREQRSPQAASGAEPSGVG